MRNAEKGTYNGIETYCPVNAYGDCYCCDANGICHMENPLEDCDDWCSFFNSWEDWEEIDDDDDYEEPYDLEMGFDPYTGCYSDDC